MSRTVVTNRRRTRLFRK